MSVFASVCQRSSIRSKQPWLVLSAAQEFSLAGSDNPAISHFYSFEASSSSEATFAIPDGCIDILFDCDKDQPNAEVFGTPMEAIDIELKSDHRYFGVRFSTGVTPDFLDTSARDLIEHHYHLLDLVPEANQLFEAVVGSFSFTEQVALFKQYYNDKEVRECSSLTLQAIHSIYQHNGNIRMKELEDITGFTCRTLQRQFQEDIGMSPKAFSRIIRCQSAVYDINHNDEVTFSNLANDLGFSDQSHFLKEFKKLVNATPLDYLNRVKNETYSDRIRCF